MSTRDYNDIRDYNVMNSIDTQAGPSVLTASDGSRTITMTDDAPRPRSLESIPNRTLRLRGGPRREQRVSWDEDVVDNEGSGRKSSKICCIYHKPRKFDESSSEESSSDSEDSDSSCSNNPQRQHRHPHPHPHDHGHGHNHRPLSDRPNETRPDQPVEVHELEKGSDRNAYENMPSSKQGKRKDPLT